MGKVKPYSYERPIVLSIAGFDPSGGAGLAADLKTFEQNDCLGMGVMTAWTVQTEKDCHQVNWLSFEYVQAQLIPLLENYHFAAIKIGIAPNILFLQEIIKTLQQYQPQAHVVWDPVLASSSGKVIMEKISTKKLEKLLPNITLITPNRIEAQALYSESSSTAAAMQMSNYTHVLLKGGHARKDKGTDLFFEQKICQKIEGEKGSFSPKHGSGCILSAAITANMAKGLSVYESCVNAKKYIEKRLKSNTGLLAYHHEYE